VAMASERHKPTRRGRQ